MTRPRAFALGLALWLGWGPALPGRAAQAQALPPADPGEAAEGQFEALGEDGADGLLERLADLAERPLDVNTASAEALALIPALGLLVADAVVRYRTLAGPFASLADLLAVPGLSEEALEAARPYLTVGPANRPATGRGGSETTRAPPRSRARVTHRVQRRLDLPAGYLGPDSARAYAGSPERLYTRVHLTRAHARGRSQSLNLTLEKDPGEPLAGPAGADFVSAHAAFAGTGLVRTLVVGDFVADVGQGVALWRASGFGKGPDAVGGPLRAGRGLRPYGSTDEARFFRGVGLTLSPLPGLAVTAFASTRRLDATLVVPDSAEGGGPYATGLVFDGLHRTPRERARRGALGQTVGGGWAEGSRTRPRYAVRVGAGGYHARHALPLRPADRPDTRFHPSGQGQTVLTAFADARADGLAFFAEIARAPAPPPGGPPGGRLGGVAGVLTRVGPRADLLVLGRHYGAASASALGHPFGERNGAGQNETGLYAGLRLRPLRTLTLDAYADRYRAPWLRYAVPRPSQGADVLVRAELRPRRWLRAHVQARAERREVAVWTPGVVPGSTVGALGEGARRSVRAQAEWDASAALRLRLRAEGVRTTAPDGTAEAGTLLYQDVRLQAARWLRVDARLALFQTDGYAARVYTFENDLTGVFAVPALHGEGSRGYVLFTATPRPGLTAQAKVSALRLRHVHAVGSGPAAVEGGRVRDVGVQLRYGF